MSDLKRRSGKKHHRGRRFSPVSAQPTDWFGIFESLPLEPPKTLADMIWNGYKKELWAKYKPDSLFAFEGLRFVARSQDTPEALKFVANLLALLCGIDGYGATVEGLRKDEERKLTLARITAPVPRLLSAWPS